MMNSDSSGAVIMPPIIAKGTLVMFNNASLTSTLQPAPWQFQR
ncbi:hypothetical protein ACN1CF_002218 [Salmonella enterica subsp. enterica serovar Soerenga]|nr:hypothetical protein [Salmonella enterica]